MTKEIATQTNLPSLPSLWELPPSLTECERREIFTIKSERNEQGQSVSRKVFLPPSKADEQELMVIKSALESRLDKSTAHVVVVALARIANHHKSDRSASEWQALYEDFVGDLSEFSNAHIVQAINEHRRSSKWFPKVSEISDRCVELRELDKCRLRRVNLSLTGKEP